MLFTPNTRNWIRGFLALDLILFGYAAFSCLREPDLCFVGIGFFVSGVYPFWWLLPENSWGMMIDVVLLVMISALLYALLGLALGRATERLRLRGSTVLVTALFGRVLITLFINILLAVTGRIN